MWGVLIGTITTFLSTTSVTWSSSAIPKLNSTSSPLGKPINEQEATWIAATLPLGSCVGTWIFCYLAKSIGRKKSFQLMGLILLISNALIAFGRIIELYYVARFFMGCAISGTFSLMPLYIVENVHVSKVVLFGSMISVASCGGLFFSNLIGPFVSISVNNGILVIISGIFLISFTLIGKESPQYQQIKLMNKTQKDVEKCVEDDEDYNFFSIFTSKSLRKGFITVNGLLFFSQLSGIDVVLFYGQKVFQEFDSGISPQISLIILGAFHFSSSLFLPMLSKYNKRPLLMVSGVGMVFSHICLAILSYIIPYYNLSNKFNILPLIFLIFYVLTYNLGFAVLPWIFLGELFPSQIKILATSLSSTLYWLTAFVITKNIFTVLDYIGLPCFFLFCSANCCLGSLFAKFYLIETTGKTLDEIQILLKK